MSSLRETFEVFKKAEARYAFCDDLYLMIFEDEKDASKHHLFKDCGTVSETEIEIYFDGFNSDCERCWLAFDTREVYLPWGDEEIKIHEILNLFTKVMNFEKIISSWDYTQKETFEKFNALQYTNCNQKETTIPFLNDEENILLNKLEWKTALMYVCEKVLKEKFSVRSLETDSAFEKFLADAPESSVFQSSFFEPDELYMIFSHFVGNKNEGTMNRTRSADNKTCYHNALRHAASKQLTRLDEPFVSIIKGYALNFLFPFYELDKDFVKVEKEYFDKTEALVETGDVLYKQAYANDDYIPITELYEQVTALESE